MLYPPHLDGNFLGNFGNSLHNFVPSTVFWYLMCSFSWDGKSQFCNIFRGVLMPCDIFVRVSMAG